MPAVSGWDRHATQRLPRRPFKQLCGHLIFAGALFFILFSMTWVLHVYSAWLNGVFPFDQATYVFISEVERIALYADTALCGAILLYAGWHFLREMTR